MSESPRYSLLDALRGLTLFSMVLYHFTYDLRVILGWDLPGWTPAFDHVWQQSICWSFILLSGVCRHFSRHHLRRGLLLLGCGCLITLVTMLAMPDQAVHFGILSFAGCAVLLTAPLLPLLRRIPAGWGIGVCFMLFLALYGLPSGHLGFGAWTLPLPESLYRFRALVPLGLPDSAFVSSDYFPLLPWYFLFLTGYFLWELMRRRPALCEKLTRRIPVLDAIGRHTLPIYMIHQPLLFGLLLLLQ